MDIGKFHIPTLNGPNFGLWYDHIMSTTRILDVCDAMRGDLLPTTPSTRVLLVKPSPPAATADTATMAAYITVKATQSKKNAQGLGLIQATVSNGIWQKYQHPPTSKEVLDALELEFGKVGGAQTYLQLVSMVKIQFTDLMDLLPQIQQFQVNYNLIMLNGHSTLSEDLAMFLFCLSLPDSY